MSRRAGAAVAVTLALAGTWAAGAGAQRGVPFDVPVTDRERDAGRGLDIVRASLGRDESGRLAGEIEMSEKWSAAKLRAKGGDQGSVCLRLYTSRVDDAEAPDFLVCATAASATGRKLRGRVLRDRHNGLPTTVARAHLTRPDGRTVRLRFTQKSIRRPSRVRFAGQSVRFGKRCPSPLGCRDSAPEAPGTVSIRLR